MHLKTCPNIAPPNRFGIALKGQLGFQEQLTAACRNLPVYEPGEHIWQNIERKLDNKKTVSLYPVVLRYLSIAAGIAIILTLSITITQRKNEIITKTMEIADNGSPVQSEESDNLSDQAVYFIDMQCKNSTYLCQVPEFSQKHQQLVEVTIELKKLNKEMETLGSSPSLFHTKTKLENIKAQLIKDLVKQVTS